MQVELRVNGNRIGGWTTARVRRSLDHIADEFTLEITNQRVDDGLIRPASTGVTVINVRKAADELREADSCEIYVGEFDTSVLGELVITGYLDEWGFNYTADRAVLTVHGRSKAGELVDCSALKRKGSALAAAGSWRKADLVTIVGELCAPYGIGVISTVSDALKPFSNFKLDPGETVFEAVSRACEMRGVFPISLATGDIELARAATKANTGAVIKLGSNVLAGGVERVSRHLFSEYRFKGQTKASDDWYGIQGSQLKGKAEDQAVGRFRPLVVLSEKQRSSEDVGRRALWERNVRAGRAETFRYTVPGWLSTRNGTIWTPNTLVRIRDEWANVDAEKLITSVEFSLADDITTTLELMDRAAFDVLERPATRKGL